MKPRPAIADPARLLGLPAMHAAFSKEEVDSLVNGFEHIGVSCIDKKGNIVKTEKIESVGNDGEAKSVKTMQEMAGVCNKDASIWWHTHAATLSSMSIEDRLTAGNLKLVTNSNMMCAIGMDGYSCHVLDKSPPTVITKRWDGSFFDELKRSAVISPTLDIDKKWRVEKVLESDMDHITCSTMEGVTACLGVDWSKGITHFPIGAYHQVVITGNADIAPEENGFSLLASASDEKLNCLSLVIGKEKKVLYCR